jgi:threonine dehydrogenase-like Zn-dependent dehydrogenase
MTREAHAPKFTGGGKIEFASRTYPDPGASELLIEVEANAICGSDREQYFQGSECIPGHETAGRVLEAGSDTSTPVGTRGAVYLMDYCGTCRSCRAGHTNQCQAKRNDMGFTADGGYGPFELVHETNFFAVPDHLSAAETTLLLDVMGTGGHALSRVGRMREDVDNFFCAGAGPIGLGVLAMAKARYGDDFPVYISDVSSWRLRFAESLGGIPIDPCNNRAVSSLPAIDAAIDSTGREPVRQQLVQLLGQRGILACVGHGGGLTLAVSSDLISTERTVLGSEYFRYDEMSANLELLLSRRDYFGQIITHRFSRSRIGEAFARFLGGETGKVLVLADCDPTVNQ